MKTLLAITVYWIVFILVSAILLIVGDFCWNKNNDEENKQ